jgi:acetyl-CoA acetyltransferase
MYGKPMTIEDHQNSEVVVDPFHLFDMCLETDGACAFVVTSAERARTLKNRPVYIMAAAQGTGPTPASWFCYPDFAISGMESVAPELYKTAGVTPKDIDTAQIYDCFTFTAMCALEGCGFCKKGEGGSFVEGGRIEIGGELPINTSGGNLSEGYIHGMTHINEAVRQLRGTAAVQVKDAELVLVTSSGPVFGLSSGLILRR